MRVLLETVLDNAKRSDYDTDMSSIPPLPPSALPTPTSPPKTEIVVRKFRVKPEPWMIGVAEKLVREMLPLRLVAGYLGVSASTLAAWRTAGEDPACSDPLLQELAFTIAKARAEMTVNGIAMLKAHAMTDYRAGLELLKAADPETWSPKSTVKLEAEVSVKPARDLSKLTLEQLDELERLEALTKPDA